ncbi:phage GP46 family protein [secondary endosymbiont of Ctenarytaina eucalypti]|uniref:Mu-like prophage protein gp46 n=1 Tax=secondary endosymbiont of Ctenarytaina eucalypti TaxID=1199245 RepID=J3TFU6_9ENTR|nr:phage GP46 family protein [secondary endosymbiont of Ctenarytaina eucalypti]AFP85182.1 Mu-like prophage protein gp46 [secondary endosymbiont of Ctenarytaina eucalypti]
MIINNETKTQSSEQKRLRRAVMMSLFTWRCAELNNETNAPMQWWDEAWPTIRNDSIGSRLYLLRQHTLTNETARQAKEHIIQALSWMTANGIVQRINVEVTRSAIDALTAKVILMLNNYSIQTIKFNNIWSDINEKNESTVFTRTD